jgi:hypothetical protein
VLLEGVTGTSLSCIPYKKGLLLYPSKLVVLF